MLDSGRYGANVTTRMSTRGVRHARELALKRVAQLVHVPRPVELVRVDGERDRARRVPELAGDALRVLLSPPTSIDAKPCRSVWNVTVSERPGLLDDPLNDPRRRAVVAALAGGSGKDEVGRPLNGLAILCSFRIRPTWGTSTTERTARGVFGSTRRPSRPSCLRTWSTPASKLTSAHVSPSASEMRSPANAPTANIALCRPAAASSFEISALSRLRRSPLLVAGRSLVSSFRSGLVGIRFARSACRKILESGVNAPRMVCEL